MASRAIAALWLALAVSRASADVGASFDGISAALDPGTDAPRIVNGLTSQDFPTTGALLYAAGATIDADNASLRCSGTLIGCSTFVTAAHCVVADTAPSHYRVFLQHGGLYPVASIELHPAYDGGSVHDVAVVKLAARVDGIAPTPINSTHNLGAMGVGLGGMIAGFGQTQGGAQDYGIKRHGAVQTAACNAFATGGAGNDKLICWDFDSPMGPPGTDANTCNGDSGGPLLMDFGAGPQLVGVTSADVAADCLPLDSSWDASVYYNAAYLTSQIGADSTVTCGGLPAVGTPTVGVVAESGTLSPPNPDDSFTVNVAGAAAVLRVTLNGEDNGSFDANLYVKRGDGGASASNYDCKADGESAFGACEFAGPATGTWSIYVSRASGSGQYQVTATALGVDPPTCGNGIKEFGEGCDGSDNAACVDQCKLDCTCPQVCTDGELGGLAILSTAQRFLFRAHLRDSDGRNSILDPRNGLALEITDQIGAVELAIPGGAGGWAKSVPTRGRFRWLGDGSIDGLRNVKLRRKTAGSGSHWELMIKGRGVPGAGTIDLHQVLDFWLTLDGTCHSATW